MTKLAQNLVPSKHQEAVLGALKQDRVLNQVFSPFFEKYSIYDLHNAVYDLSFLSVDYAPKCYLVLAELSQDTLCIIADLNDIEGIRRSNYKEVVKDMMQVDDRLQVLKVLDTALLKVQTTNTAHRKTLTAWRNAYFIYCSTINGWNLSGYENE